MRGAHESRSRTLGRLLTTMKPDEKKALDVLGKLLVEEVFDQSCRYLQVVICRGMRGQKPDPLHEAYASLDDESATVLRRFLLEAVDQTFAQFLHFLDMHEFPLPVEVESGRIVDLKGVSDGLDAEPYNEGGWIERYSQFKDGITPEPR